MFADTNLSGRQHQVFTALDGLRGVAALSVVLYHIPGFVGQTLLPSAYLAVDLFFCISGFVLAKAYGGKLRAGMPLADFMLRRLIRLYPLFLLSGAFCYAYLACFGNSFIGHTRYVAYTLNLFFIPYALPDTHNSVLYPLNSIAWTLAIELILSALYGKFFPYFLNMRYLALQISVSLLSLLAFSICFGGLNVGVNFLDAGGAFSRGIFSFSCGIMISLVRRPSAPSSSTFTFLAIAALVVALLSVAVSGIFRIAYDLFVVALIFPLLVLSASHCEIQGMPRRAALALGSASYGLYILQTPAGAFVGQWLSSFGMKPSVALGLVFTATLFFLILAVDRYVDRPIRAILLSHLGQGKSPATTAS